MLAVDALAAPTNPECFEPVAFDAKVEPLGKSTQQALDLAPLKSRNRTTAAADQMMLVAGLGNHIAVLAFRAVYEAKPLMVVEQLEGAIDRCTPNM